MAGRLTTHVLDTANGCPAAGMALQLFRIEDALRIELENVRTNADGRCDRPLLNAETLIIGQYELCFHVADYFGGRGLELSSPAFLDVVPIRFGLADANQHYHVPLLVAPYGYSTYRGS